MAFFMSCFISPFFMAAQSLHMVLPAAHLAHLAAGAAPVAQQEPSFFMGQAQLERRMAAEETRRRAMFFMV